MSGKYLHGLIIDSDFVYVRDNVFSHSELRGEWLGMWLGTEKKHRLIKEWSWDYVWRLISNNTTHKDRLVLNFLKADA